MRLILFECKETKHDIIARCFPPLMTAAERA